MSGGSMALWIYGLASLLALVAFALDKRRARLGRRRVSEASLHVLEFLGGWPGALLAMQLVRHKRRKPRYWAVTLAIAALHLAAWAVVLGRASS